MNAACSAPSKSGLEMSRSCAQTTGERPTRIRRPKQCRESGSARRVYRINSASQVRYAVGCTHRKCGWSSCSIGMAVSLLLLRRHPPSIQCPGIPPLLDHFGAVATMMRDVSGNQTPQHFNPTRRFAAVQGSSRSSLMKKGSMSLYSRILTVVPLGAFPCAIARNACSDCATIARASVLSH